MLNTGKVAEYDSPAQLLEDNSSSFSKLVTEFLRRSSKNNYDRDLSWGRVEIIYDEDCSNALARQMVNHDNLTYTNAQIIKYMFT